MLFMFFNTLIHHELPNFEAVAVFSVRVLLPALTASAIAVFVSLVAAGLVSQEMLITCWAGI